MGARRIWLMNADGSGKRQLTNDPAYRDERPSWSADGSRVLFVRMTGDQAQLWLMNADGSGPRPVVDELTPRPDWFGYYGYTDWGQLFDWWKGMPRAVQQPISLSSPTMNPSPAASAMTSATGLDAFLRAAASFLEGPDARQLPEATVALQLKDLARENGVEINYIKRSDGNPEAWAGWSWSPSHGAFLLWRLGDEVSYQVWPGSGKDSFSGYLVNPVQMLRLIEKDGAVEMGLIPANIGSTGEAWFVLARLANGRWQEIWSPARATRGTWAGSGGKVEFAGSGIDILKLRGPIPQDVPASRTFDEFGVFLKQQYESEWRRQGEEYVRVGGRIAQTPLTALADFLDRLQREDRAGAHRLVTDPAVVDEALKLGLDEPASGRGWAGVSQTAVEGMVYIQFLDNDSRERSFRAALVEEADGYRVRIVEKIAPVLPGGSVPTPIRVGGR